MASCQAGLSASVPPHTCILPYASYRALRERTVRARCCRYCSIAFVQFLGVYSTFDIPWEGSLKTLFRTMRLMNLNLDALHLTCVHSAGGGLTFAQTWIIQMLLPLLYPLLVCIHYSWARFLHALCKRGLPPCHFLVRHGWRPQRDFTGEHLFGLYVPPALFYLNMYFVGGIITSFRALNCNDDGQGGSFLLADPQITCWGASHWKLAAGGILGVLLYLGCVPCVYCWVLFRLLPKYGRNHRLTKAFQFLYGRFEPKYAWWELVEMFRKVTFVLISFSRADDPLIQSMLSLFSVILLYTADLHCNPFVSNLYNVLEEVIAFVEIMVLLLGLFILGRPESAWPNTMSWFMLIAAFVIVLCVTIVDFDSLWQKRRVVKLRRSRRVGLSPLLFEVGSFNTVLVDWVEQASEESIGTFHVLNQHLMHALHDGALKPSPSTRRYHDQLKVQPYLLDKLVGLHGDDAETVGDLCAADDMLLKYLESWEEEPLAVGGLPSHYLFNKTLRGPLARWLAQPAQLEMRTMMREFFLDIHDYAQGGVSRTVALKQALVMTGGNAKQQKKEAKLANKARAHAAKAKAHSPTSDSVDGHLEEATHGATHGTTASVSVAIAASLTSLPSWLPTFIAHELATLFDIGLKEQPPPKQEPRIRDQLKELNSILNCEMVELVPAPVTDRGGPCLPAREVLIHEHVCADPLRLRLSLEPTAWSADPATPMGLCVSQRKAIRVDVGFTDDRFQLPFRLGEISQLIVPIFATESKTTFQSLSRDIRHEQPLIGVIRCVNKFPNNHPFDSRSGFKFREEDEDSTSTYARIFGQYATNAARFKSNVKLLQRATRTYLLRKAKNSQPKLELNKTPRETDNSTRSQCTFDAYKGAAPPDAMEVAARFIARTDVEAAADSTVTNRRHVQASVQGAGASEWAGDSSAVRGSPLWAVLV